MEIHIDYREYRLIESFQKNNTPIKIKNLYLGDIQIVNQSSISPDQLPGSDQSLSLDKPSSINLLFERKTWTDLASSIKDSRYHEQKVRILSEYEPHNCTYIIEGPEPTLIGDNVLSAVVHTRYRDRIHVVYTADIAGTAEYIQSVFKRVVANPDYFTQSLNQQQQEPPNYLSTIKIKKKDNITPESCYLLQLSQIPGVSIKIATEIAKVYPNYYILLKTLKDLPTDQDRIKLLKQIKMIAVKKAQVIIEYLFI